MLTSDTLLNDRYYLQQLLNSSPARQTWLARDNTTQIQVIVKLLALGGAVQWDELKLFEREAQILQQLDHPRVPKYYDYFSLDDRSLWFALVQQYIPGQSLKQKLDCGQPLSLQQVQRTLEDVLEILQYLHRLHPPILHRDIKPSNLLWGEDNRVYLLDFGAVQVRPPAAAATFTVVGTYGYTPLEQYGGQSVPASDLYSLGATAIHLLTGVAPSELAKDDFRLQFRDRLAAGTDERFIAWLEKLTEPSPQKRFSSAKEALESLQHKSTVTPSVAQPARGRLSRLLKTSEQLTIEIPSRFEIECIKPFQRSFGSLFRSMGGGLRSKEKVQKALGWGILTVAGICTLVSFTGLASALVGLVLLPFSLLPYLALLWLILSLRGSTYFQRTQVSFNRNVFEIRHNAPGGRVERGELAQIEEVYLTKWRDRTGQPHHGISIATQTKRKILFFAAQRDRQFLFGQYLSEYELHWLAGEIQDWLNAIRFSKP
ncbi:serine/threonine-protein kinase [Oscillatoria sp. FACHB-1406]|uniref:serine/threonine protein kinase n=1 Tax=Oscillatoria sp. FACHB-1406 TaxID=2692846 RepID=UPI001687CC0E|nr:serine/threonine-protein kinase [Oscillatoria sp. FACHB-1406]MBD2577841.1 serine/threonine protein kinase [Oscillatoria sp. FACHB-1406]